MEHILRNVLMALLEEPDATLHDVLRIFSDKEFRIRVARSLRNEPVRRFLLISGRWPDRAEQRNDARGELPLQNNQLLAKTVDPVWRVSGASQVS
jgi:hypothetical protein